MLIINTGGTFNKIYNPLTGELDIPSNDDAINSITSNFSNPYQYTVIGMIYKDSLDMTDDDRSWLLDVIREHPSEKIVIVHGTDTMDETAEYLSSSDIPNVIVITGAMVPFSIDPVEATSNLSMAISYCDSTLEKGVYICMQGEFGIHTSIIKNRTIGVFEKKL